VSNDNYDSTSTAAVYYNVSLAKAASQFAVTNDTLIVNTSETEANIATAIGAKITYQTKSTPTADEETQTIDLNLTNAKFEYKTASGVYTTGLPTAEGTYNVRITYTGTEAGNLTVVAEAEAVTLTISKYAASLAGQGVTEEEEPVLTGLVDDEETGVTYLYDENGKLVKSAFLKVGSKTYYANKYGVVQKGKIFTAKGTGKKFYATKTGAIRMNGIYSIVGGGKIYAYADGHLLVSGSKVVDGDRYVADKNGKLVKSGFTTTAKGYRYCMKNYKAIKNKLFTYTDGKTYIANKNGTILKGNKVVTFGGKKYYVYAKGSVAKNKTVTYNGKKYVANAKGVLTKK
jgi:hypothetical protein